MKSDSADSLKESKSAEKAMALVRELYERFNRGDLDALVADLAPEVVWIEPHPAPKGSRFESREAVRDQVLQYSLDTFEPVALVPDELTWKRGRVIVTGTFVGQHRKTREEYRLPFFHVWVLQDGKVKAFRHTNDARLQTKALQGERITF